MAVDSRFESALSSSDPINELRRIAKQLLDEGRGLSAVRDQFERVRNDLREADREHDEDAVMDVLDFLSGWCSPHARLGERES